jgi:glycosyltransferase involved in cell wall biosynthesis
VTPGRLHVLQIFQPQAGGVPTYVRHLSRGLVERGWRVTLAGPAAALDHEAIRGSGVELLPLEFGRFPRPLADRRVIRLLQRYASAHAVTLVHAHSTKAGIVGGIAARSARTRSVYTPHAGPFDMAAPWPVRRGCASIERWLCTRYRDRVIAVCEHEREVAQRWRVCDGTALTVVRTGLPEQPLPSRAQARDELGLAHDQAVVAWVGRNAAQKRPQDLARLALLLGADTILVALGSGLAGTYEGTTLAVEGGRVLSPRTSTSTVYAAADVLVQTSAWEALPLAVLEGMQAGLPVVAYAAGGTTEEIVDGVSGHLVEIGDVAGLAEHTRRLLIEGKDRRRMGARASALARERFDYGRMLAEIDAVYRHELEIADVAA